MYLSGYAIETVYCKPELEPWFSNAPVKNPRSVEVAVSVANVIRVTEDEGLAFAYPAANHPYVLSHTPV
jgi:hypothetical protein